MLSTYISCMMPQYIHHLWAAGESCLLARRLNDFFPGSLGVEEPSQLLFHVDLSEDEEECFAQLGMECKEWLNLVLDWERKREETCQNAGCVSRPMFQVLTFMCPCEKIV